MMRKLMVWTMILMMMCFSMAPVWANGPEGQVMEYSWYQEGASRHRGTLSSSSFEDGWNDVMDKCSSGFDVYVTLYEDWIAYEGEFTDDVFNGPGFQDDVIRVRQGASVTLDLNGFSIDRGTTLDVKNGEVLHVETDGELTVKNGTVIGSVHITNGKAVTFDNCVFKDNEDIDFGAAIYVEGCEELLVENCIFTNLEDDSNGAAIEAERTAITVIGSTFRNCTTEHDGGAVYVHNGSLDVTNSQFTGNHAGGNGGAVAVVDTETNIATCTLGNNAADKNGGALYVGGDAGKKTEIYLSNFADNTAWENGGALAVADQAQLTLHGCIVDENTALVHGGAAYVGQTAAMNTADYNDELGRDVYPTKFIGNEASEKGDVIFVDTPDGGIEEGEEWVEPTEVGRNENVGFDVTDIVLTLSVVFVAVTVVLNFRKAK